MRRRSPSSEILIALGVTAAVTAMGFLILIAAGPELRRPRNFDNICLLDRTLAFQKSAIGQSANAQLLELKEAAQGALNAEKAAIDKLPAGSAREMAMSRLLEKLRRDNASLELVRTRAQKLVIRAIAPTIEQAAVFSKCAVILDRSVAIDNGTAKDLTGELVTAIDKAVPPLPAGALKKSAF